MNTYSIKSDKIIMSTVTTTTTEDFNVEFFFHRQLGKTGVQVFAHQMFETMFKNLPTSPRDVEIVRSRIIDMTETESNGGYFYAALIRIRYTFTKPA